MIQQDDPEIAERDIPEIIEEEDAPFPTQYPVEPENRPNDTKLNESDRLDKEIIKFRYRTGRKVLYIAMSAMGFFVALDLFASSALGVKSDLVANAFEAFKLIAMTVLGYIFGAHSSK